MKSLMIVAGDVALTRFVAETLLGRAIDKRNPDLSGNGWTITRAHSGLEALVMAKSSGLRFDAVVLDQSLPDKDLLKMLEALRAVPSISLLPIFVMSERGRDVANRRLAAESFHVAGFIDKPVTADAIRRGLKDLERMRTVLLVDTDEARAGRHEQVLRRNGFAVDIARRAKDAQKRVSETRPDAVISAIALPDKNGIELCVALKRNASTHEIPVILYGRIEEIESQEIEENAHRADEFIEEPFDPESLLVPLTSLVGRGASRISSLPPDLIARGATEVRAPTFEDTTTETPEKTPPPVLEKNHAHPTQRLVPNMASTVEQVPTLGNGNETYDVHANDEEDDDPARTVELRKKKRRAAGLPPASASPTPSVPSQRAKGRRVPCHLSVAIQEGGTIYKSETLNISDGGILITTDHPLEIGTHIDLTLTMPTQKTPIVAVGKVAWVSKTGDGRSGVGVKFSRIDPNDLKSIVDYVNRVSRVVYVAP